jgi:nickel-dependent lactate racemase
MRVRLQEGRDGIDVDIEAPNVAVVIPDITRPLPSARLLPWLFAELDHVPPERFVIVNGTGSHRPNTNAELASMLGREVVERYRVVKHQAQDPAALLPVGRSTDGQAVLLNREYVEADRRIVLGFIEPHFMAGFSGGCKGIFPALGDFASIQRYHDAGCAFSKQTAMVACERPFPIVVTTNSGYPLDQNLYQTVKGMSAAAQVVVPGGYIATAARCNDGFPEHGNFRELLFEHASPRALLDTIEAPGFSLYDQWEAQLLALIQLKARVGLLSELSPADVRRAFLEPIEDVGAAVSRELTRIGRDAPVAVLPEGPQTIPYVRSGAPRPS